MNINEKKTSEEGIIERPPIVVVMGHIDHGKSTLLDYIRKTNVVEKEAGGITQNISAYEVEIPGKSGSKEKEKITFIDTPGHEAFSKMRERGANIADIAILVVSAEDGVKPQTLEAWKTISQNKIPSVVAINKIDKPNANVEKTKIELAENEIYLENYGGKIPFVEISAKTGAGVDDLLNLLAIIAEMEGYMGEKNQNATGFILESNLDSKRGIQATLVIKNGSIKKGMVVVAEESLCSSNIMENYKGEPISFATFSSPIRLVGFSKIPNVGAQFKSFETKKEAEDYAEDFKKSMSKESSAEEIRDESKKIIPLVLKADILGSIEAIEKEIKKLSKENAEFKIIQKGVGLITESDIKSLGRDDIIVIGFNVKADKNVSELANIKNINIHFFDIIYKMTEWLEEEIEKRRPKIETMETLGRAKILKIFSRTKEKHIAGGKVLKGKIVLDKTVKILRREHEIGRGKIVNLEKNRVKTKEVEEGSEFGMMIESKIEIVEGDMIESFNITEK